MAEHYLDERTYRTGDVICAEGDTTTEMFIIQEGKVGVTKKVAGRETFIAVRPDQSSAAGRTTKPWR